MSTSVASVVSHFPDAENGFTTTTAGSVSSGASTVTLNSVAGYTNGQPVVLVIDPTDASKKQTFTGIIDTSGVQITSVVWTAGTNTTHALGATVVDYATATHIAMISKGIQVEHKQDGTHKAITADSVTVPTGKITTTAVGKLEDMAIPLTTYRSNYLYDFVASGGVWTADAAGSTRLASMTAMVAYINGRRIAVSAVTSRTFTASKDVYVDLLDNADGTGTLVYTDGTTNAASSALAANSIRIAIVVVGASNIAAAASINQGQEDRILPIASSIPYTKTDSLGNLICPRDPQRMTLGYRQIVSNATSTATSAAQITGLTCPVIVPTGRSVKVTAFGGALYSNTNGASANMTLWDGTVGSGTQLNIAKSQGPTAAVVTPGIVIAQITPASASKTYNAGLHMASAGTATIEASSTAPLFIKVELA